MMNAPWRQPLHQPGLACTRVRLHGQGAWHQLAQMLLLVSKPRFELCSCLQAAVHHKVEEAQRPFAAKQGAVAEQCAALEARIASLRWTDHRLAHAGRAWCSVASP